MVELLFMVDLVVNVAVNVAVSVQLGRRRNPWPLAFSLAVDVILGGRYRIA